MTEFINKVWKAADDDFRSMLKAANGHAYDDHIGKTLDEIREIADYQGKLCSTFTDEATALKAIRESLQENAKKVTNWLDNGAQGELELIGNHGYDLGFGVRPSSITKIKPLNSSRMYLVKDTTQVSGFRIKQYSQNNEYKGEVTLCIIAKTLQHTDDLLEVILVGVIDGMN